MENPEPLVMKRIFFLLLIFVFGMVCTGLAQASAPAPDTKVHRSTPTALADAHKNKSTVWGTCQVVFDASGYVKTAVMTKSLGSKVLDENTTSYARKTWTGQPNTKVNIPISYKLTPPVKGSKGDLQAYTPVPPYPYQAVRARLEGSGTAKVSFDETGKAISVTMVKSTGSSVLDDNTIAYGFANWRSMRGKMTSFVPVAYRLR